MNKKYINYILVGVVALIIVGLLVKVLSPKPQITTVAGVGDINSTQRIASCVLDMSTTTPTYASTTPSGVANTSSTGCLYNGDSKDRVITSVEFYISSLGAVNTSVASSTWKMGTSSDIYNVPATASQVLNTSIATTTGNGAVQGATLTLFVASTTPGATATFPNRIWNAGTNLNLQQNASSTWVGTVLVRYFSNN